MKLHTLTIIILSVILLASIAVNLYQSENSIKLTHKNQELTSKQNSLSLKMNYYLEAEGRKCKNEIENCLDVLTVELKSKSGKDCSGISDDICPVWCAAGADYDCCIEKGYQWIDGRGCY